VILILYKYLKDQGESPVILVLNAVLQDAYYEYFKMLDVNWHCKQTSLAHKAPDDYTVFLCDEWFDTCLNTSQFYQEADGTAPLIAQFSPDSGLKKYFFAAHYSSGFL
jgi:hypothetical protein